MLRTDACHTWPGYFHSSREAGLGRGRSGLSRAADLALIAPDGALGLWGSRFLNTHNRSQDSLSTCVLEMGNDLVNREVCLLPSGFMKSFCSPHWPRYEMRTVLLLPLTPLVLLVALVGQLSPPGPLSISITAPQSTISTGQPLKIKAEVANNSTQPIGEIRPYSYFYHVHVSDSDGKVLAKKRDYEFGIATQHFSRYVIPPGETVARFLVVTDMYDMSRPGQYSIQVEGQNGVLSNFITVTVTEQTEEPLRTAEPKDSFSLAIESVGQDIIKPGGKAAVKVIVTNNTSSVMRFDNSPGLFSLEVADVHGVSATPTELGRNIAQRLGTHATSFIGLHSAQAEATNQFIITDFYDLSEPGVYTVQVSRRDESTGVPVRSNTTTITVLSP